MGSLTLDVPQFKIGGFGQVQIWFGATRAAVATNPNPSSINVCLAAGPYMDAVTPTLTVSMNFEDCYFLLIENLFTPP